MNPDYKKILDDAEAATKNLEKALKFAKEIEKEVKNSWIYKLQVELNTKVETISPTVIDNIDLIEEDALVNEGLN